MEVIGIVLLLAVFGLGFAVTYIFSRYLNLLNMVREHNEEVLRRLQALEEKLGREKEEIKLAQSESNPNKEEQ